MEESKKNDVNHYVNNKEFQEEMIIWITKYREAKKDNRPLPRITESIGQKIYAICNNLAKAKNFSRYTWKDMMIGDAIENCIKYLHNYNIDKYNSPYSYVNRIAWQAFVRRIKLEKKRDLNHRDYIKSLGGYTDELFQSDENSHDVEQVITDKVQSYFDDTGNYKTKPTQ